MLLIAMRSRSQRKRFQCWSSMKRVRSRTPARAPRSARDSMISRGMKMLVPPSPGARPDLGDPVAVAGECGLHAVPPRHRGVEDRLAEAQSGGAQTLDRNVQIVPVLRQPDILVGCIVGMNAEVERDGL